MAPIRHALVLGLVVSTHILTQPTTTAAQPRAKYAREVSYSGGAITPPTYSDITPGSPPATVGAVLESWKAGFLAYWSELPIIDKLLRLFSWLFAAIWATCFYFSRSVFRSFIRASDIVADGIIAAEKWARWEVRQVQEYRQQRQAKRPLLALPPPPRALPVIEIEPEPAPTISTPAQITLGYSNREPLGWSPSVRGNPHLLIVGKPGMGKTTTLLNIVSQLESRGITPVIFAYHSDIEADAKRHLSSKPITVSLDNGLGFDPLEAASEREYLDKAGALRDVFRFIFPDLGDRQSAKLFDAIKGLRTAPLSTLVERLADDEGISTRLSELADYGLLRASYGDSLLAGKPVIVRLHDVRNETVRRALAAFTLLNCYQEMTRRGPQSGITHMIILDEAHLAASLSILDSMAKESRKFGISLVVSSQEVRDFSPSLVAALANYCVLRVSDQDARFLANQFGGIRERALLQEAMIQMPKYQAILAADGKAATQIKLAQASTPTSYSHEIDLDDEEETPPTLTHSPFSVGHLEGKEHFLDISAGGVTYSAALPSAAIADAHKALSSYSDMVPSASAWSLVGVKKSKFSLLLKANPTLTRETRLHGNVSHSYYPRGQMLALGILYSAHKRQQESTLRGPRITSLRN